MRVSEIYRSVQGEGPRVGLATTFVRFGGCNLRCPGWPCDTPYAIEPKTHRNEWRKMSADEVSAETVSVTSPSGNVCLTGGEPWLQNHTEMRSYLNFLWTGAHPIECFSNGSLDIPDWAFEVVNFVFDYKLPGSGETTVNPEIFLSNLHRGLGAAAFRRDAVALKFTVADLHDFSTAYTHWEAMVKEDNSLIHVPVYVAPVWGKVEPSELVEWLLTSNLPWRLNLQVHKYIWDADKRGI